MSEKWAPGPLDNSKVPGHSLLEVRNISKKFPGVIALDDITFSLKAGEILGIVGENGAGKSTLMKSISGALAPDSGQILIDGVALTLGDPRIISQHGLSMIYQELTVIPNLSAEENVCLGAWPGSKGFLKKSEMRETYLKVSEVLGSSIPAKTLGSNLSVAEKQIVEILRALVSNKQVIILDEPTTALGLEERTALKKIMKNLAHAGKGLAFISHDLDDVLDICDRVMVLREGRVVTIDNSASQTKDSLVKSMLGREIKKAKNMERNLRSSETPTIKVRNLHSSKLSIDDLAIYPGEITAIAGLVGSGRSELFRALLGADAIESGSMTVQGVQVSWPKTVTDGIKLGFALAPEERKTEGLVLSLSAENNVALPNLSDLSMRKNKSFREHVKKIVSQVGFNPAKLGVTTGSFSGGNQQKLVLARWLLRKPTVLLLDEPTKGIDIGAKEEVFSTIQKTIKEDPSMSVVIASSDFDEVSIYADRILIMHNGEIISDNQKGITVDEILSQIFLYSKSQKMKGNVEHAS
jgi:ABC-type sugar transport system ATPase subunit